jgi:lipopolysaccharide exporter
VRPQLLGRDASDMVIRFVPGLANFLRRAGAVPPSAPSSSLSATLGEQRP